MISIDEYKINPCRVSSIPYWKIRTFKIPNNISVIHDEDYNTKIDNHWIDTQYFRLKHNLQSVELFPLDKMFEYREVDINNIKDLQEVVSIINKCYIDIQVDLSQVTNWTKSEVFCKNLWEFIIDVNTQKPVALGIAELVKNVREGMLEWIQVLPEYRKCKFGQAIVMKLLVNLIDKADFVTVSGQVNNKTSPEKLYRKCGFEGNDIWHILARK
jgi:GNAT superfamily N-acetyltransferase